MHIEKELFAISTFWHGPQLRLVDRLCLMSMMKAGHHVKLYSYMPIDNVPKGIELCDANEIMPFDLIYRLDPDFPAYKPNVTIAQFSDFFRTFLMRKGKTVWLDTDVYLVKPFLVDPKEIWLAHDTKKRLGISALYFPEYNPILEEFETYLKSDKLLPDWLGVKRRIFKPFYLRLKRKPVTLSRIGVTVFGNDGMSRLAKKYDFFDKAKPKNTFYYWQGRRSERIFDPKYGLVLLEDKNFLGFHIHYKNKTKEKPVSGSFYDWAVKRIPEFQDYNKV